MSTFDWDFPDFGSESPKSWETPQSGHTGSVGHQTLSLRTNETGPIIAGGEAGDLRMCPGILGFLMSDPPRAGCERELRAGL